MSVSVPPELLDLFNFVVEIDRLRRAGWWRS